MNVVAEKIASPQRVQRNAEKPLPQGWRWVPVGDICDLVNGDAYQPGDWNTSGLPIIRIQNLNDVTKPFNYWDGPAEDRVVVKPGNVLLAWSGTPGTSFGAHLWTRGCGVLNQHIFRVDLDETAAAKEWFVFAVNHRLDVLIAKAHGGVGLRHVTKREVESLTIPLPPLPEQKRIAGLLSEQMAQVQRARNALQDQLQAAAALPAAGLRQVFNSPQAQARPRRRLGDVLRLRKEIIHPHDKPKGPAVFVGLEHIEPNTGRRIGSIDVDMSKLTGRKPQFHKGDIVYGYLRPYLNKIWIADFGGLCSVDQFAFEVDTRLALTGFVAWFMRSPVYLERSRINTTTGQLPRIGTGEVAGVEFGCPSLDEQRKVLRSVDSEMAEIEKLRHDLESQLAALDHLPAALLRRAFAGEL